MAEAMTRHHVFYQAVEAAMRALANDPELHAVFGPESPHSAGATVFLPDLSAVPDPREVGSLRGEADAVALRRRFHDRMTYQRGRPRGRTGRAVFEALEQARVEAVGAQRLVGCAGNLSEALDKRCRDKGYDQVSDRADVPVAEAIGVYMRHVLSGRRLPASAQNLVELWRPWFEARASEPMSNLARAVNNQAAFARATRHLIDALGFGDEEAEEDDEDEQAEEQAANDSDDQGESDEGDADADSDSSSSESREQASAEGESTEDRYDDEEGLSGDTEETEEPGNAQLSYSGDNRSREPFYKAFTTSFDEIVPAEALCDEAELARLRTMLDERLQGFNTVVGRLANRLQRRLLAQQRRSWEFDCEEGLLDCARLPRVVANPLQPLSYKVEKETKFRDTVVTLLIDNSGSMRGRPIMLAAMSADILARTLDRCGVKSELLGFTTRAWKGGQSREQWLAQERPANPGRLNDLRHIIYKTADMPWRRARKHLGLMLREGLLKENIDGEALLWAHNRLLSRSEQRRILMVISDGAPVDDSTLSSNPRNYLERHLCAVVDWIERYSNVDLIAIGIGHDVGRYYRRAVTITDPEQLGGTVLEQLAELFDEKPAARQAAFERRQRFQAGIRARRPHPRAH